MANSAEQKCMENFFKLIISSRDAVFSDLDGVFNGGAIDRSGILATAKRISGSEPEALQDMENICRYCIDSYIYQLMFNIQDFEIEDGAKILVETDGVVTDIASASDGLVGDLMGEEGLFATQSKFGLNFFEIEKPTSY